MYEVAQALEATLGQWGLSLARLRMLAVLLASGEDGVTPSALAGQGGVTRATVTGLVDGLEHDGLVVRIKHPGDRRSFHVHLTPKGRELITAVMPRYYGQISAVMGRLAEPELQQLVALMEKIGAASD